MRHTYICLGIFIYGYKIPRHIHICRFCTYTYVYVYVFIFACAHCMCLYVCMRRYIRTYWTVKPQSGLQRHKQKHPQTHTHTHTHTHTYAHTHRLSNQRPQSPLISHTNAHTHTRTHASINAHRERVP